MRSHGRRGIVQLGVAAFKVQLVECLGIFENEPHRSGVSQLCRHVKSGGAARCVRGKQVHDRGGGGGGVSIGGR